ncbi:uncharacterized protein LOC132295170 [Cornus florida]|uniref:uncharacterized protein LOC132295170 n=1 Tax=Cornus florida TaxID=4283 RepID=UPI00289F4CF4|nr:uncharacterized protein LOC132295170 [Cornus florida]XP_059649302.1 uncharacterized protein LOC132295170 [Cornus florida]
MGTLLGFRHPQFSEDVAWLPAWLQQNHAEPFDEHIKEGETPLGQWFEDQDNVIAGKDVNLSSSEDGRYKTCHLFLSGEDNSAVSFSPSSKNVIHFHLQLSVDGNMPSSPLDASQTEKLESNNVLLMQQAQTPAGQEEHKNQVKMDDNASVANLHLLNSLRETSEYSGQSLAGDKDCVTENEENVKHLKVTDISDDINDAVELSIAASEALVIHEIVKNGSSTKILPAGALLEVALRVKQTRLESLEETLCCPTEEIDEIDFLSDLDESTMADAFEDVGLSVIGVDNMGSCDSISQVKDSFTSYNHYECDESYKYEGHGAMEIGYDDICMEQQVRDAQEMNTQVRNNLPLESFDGNRANKLVDDPAFGLTTFGEACHDDPILQCSFVANSDVLATTERSGFSMGRLTSFQPQPNVNSSSQVWSSENAEKDDQLTNVVPDRFQSRWLGGWTWKKDLNASAPMEHNNAKSIPEFFVGEKSYLSESADFAPDENSFVQKQDKGSNMTSQPSIAFEDLCNRTNEDILLSQDVVRSSSLSLIDPLCSVVPCSISSPCSTIAQNPNNNVDAEKCFSPVAELRFENMQRTSSLNVEFVHGKGKVVPKINGEGSQITVHRQLASLRTFSMLFPRCDDFQETENIYHSRSFQLNCMGLLSSEQNMVCKKGSTGSPSFKSILKCTTARRVEENHENPVTDLTNQKINQDETAKDGAALQVHMQKEGNSPFILKGGTCCQFQDSKHILHGFSGEENLEWTKVPESDFWLLQRKSIQNRQSKRKILRDNEIPARKRVRFLDADIKLMQKKSLQKLQYVYRKGSTTRTGKRLKYSNLHSKFRDQEAKRGRTNCLNKDGKILIFQNMEFLLTGLSGHKEKEIEGLIRKYGGIVLSDIPSPNPRGKKNSKFNHQQLPVVLCFKKLQTTKFLYGCAVNASILKVNWLTDSIAAGSVLPPEKYVILSRYDGGKCTGIGKPLCGNNHHYIFDGVGIMLHGKPIFCLRLAKVVKHGGGQVFKTLQWLVKSCDAEKISVGAIVAEDDSRASRHLKHCAAEKNIPMMPVSWIINSLHVGKVLPFKENNQSSPSPAIKVPVSMELSEEI